MKKRLILLYLLILLSNATVCSYLLYTLYPMIFPGWNEKMITRIGNYELQEHLFFDENIDRFRNDYKLCSVFHLCGGGGKLWLEGPYYQLQYFSNIVYPAYDNGATLQEGLPVGVAHTGGFYCYHFMNGGRWSDFVEDVRFIKNTQVLVIRYHNNDDPNWYSDVEFECYAFVHHERKAVIQLRYLKNNNASEERTVKLVFYLDLKIGGDGDNDQGVWDESRGAFLCWDQVNPKGIYLLVGSPETPTHRAINADMGSQCWSGQITDNDSYGPGDCGVGFQYDITLSPGEEKVIPFYIAIGETQEEAESEWDNLTSKTYAEILADVVSNWRDWVNSGIIVEFEDKPWLTEAWVNNLIAVRSLMWDNGGICGGTGIYRLCYPWDSSFAARTLINAGRIDEARRYFSFLRSAVANDPFDPYPGAYNYNGEYDPLAPGGPDLVHGCYMPVINVWRLYEKTGDINDLADNWEMIKKYLDYVLSNFFDETYNLVIGTGMLDHPYRYHEGWAEGKYYASFQIGYYMGFKIAAQIADILGYDMDKERYEDAADRILNALIERFVVDGMYKSIWHPTGYSPAEGWDSELAGIYGRVEYTDSYLERTFWKFKNYWTDYLPYHYDETEDQWIYGYALADLLSACILYGDYKDFWTLYNRFAYVANRPYLQTGERCYTYEKPMSSVFFSWSPAITGSIAYIFDWKKDEDGNYIFTLSPVSYVGRFKVKFPDGTELDVEATGDGNYADVKVSPAPLETRWISKYKKLQFTLKPGSKISLRITLGSRRGMAYRSRIERSLNFHGSTVEVLERREVGRDEYGNPEYEWLSKWSEKALIQKFKGDETAVEAGLISRGDVKAIFSSSSEISGDHRIRIDGRLYDVVSVDRVFFENTPVMIRAVLRLVNE